MAIRNCFLFVWMGTSFPYHCRLAVESALLSDPAAAVEIHIYGAMPEGADFEQVARYERVAIRSIDDLPGLFEGLDDAPSTFARLFDRIPERAASARSNLIRYGLLHTYGGVYVDFDVLLLREMSDLRAHSAFIGKERVWRDGKKVEAGERSLRIGLSGSAWTASYLLRRVDAHVFGGRKLLEPPARWLERGWATFNQNNAVIGAVANSSFIRRVLRGALHQDPAVRFALGPTLVTKVVGESAEDVYLCAEETLYPVPPSCSFQFFYGRCDPLPTDTRLIHYVASNHKDLLRSLDESSLQRSSSSSLFFQEAMQVAQRAPGLPGV